MTKRPDPDFDTCGWCGDYRHQHYARGCKICGRYPWERGLYACTGFVEEGETAPQIKALEASAHQDRRMAR